MATASGARVDWENICKPKKEGGLGLRRLDEFQEVFEPKRVWNLFSQSGSIWVAWINNNVFSGRNFWVVSQSTTFSFVTWMIMLSRLPTRDRLLSWGMSISALCPLCSNAPESHAHLFFGCPYSVAVWSHFSGWMFTAPPDLLMRFYACLIRFPLFLARVFGQLSNS